MQTELITPAQQDEGPAGEKYLIFSMGEDEQYGIDIRHIAEIIGIQPVIRIPELPEYIKGITNLRGTIIPVMDIRLRFKKAPKEYDDRTCIIVLDFGGNSMGLIVDGVTEVLSIPPEDIAPPPDMGSLGHKYVSGIGKSGGSVTLLLNCHKLLDDDAFFNPGETL